MNENSAFCEQQASGFVPDEGVIAGRPAVSVIVPTYREADNISVLVGEIDASLRESRIDYEVLIVDDNSGDGTIGIVERLRMTYPVRLFVRYAERGLSSAVLAGFEMARGDILVVMDADLSHPPSKIPGMVRLIDGNKADFVIGSRFVDGGSIPHFGAFRKLNAWVSKMLAYPLVSVQDPMSGFFAFPRRLLPARATLNPLGFKIGLELLVKAGPRSVAEIPIEFGKRLHGESKLSLRQQLQYLIHLLRLYKHQYTTAVQFLQFSLVGGSGVLVNLGAVFVSYDVFFLPYSLSLVIGFLFSVLSNFVLNKVITFEESNNDNLLRRFATFLAIGLLGLVVNMIISLNLYSHVDFFRQYYLLASMAGIISGTVVNFTGSRLLVFREK